MSNNHSSETYQNQNIVSNESRRGRVLVVDDEEGIRRVLGRFLQTRGFEVFMASTGAEAMELVKKEKPQAIFLDMNLPGTDGMEVLKSIREADRQVSVTMITGDSDAGLAEQSKRFGACGFITKPFDFQSILVALQGRLVPQAA